MDKKDLNENEHLGKDGNTEELESSEAVNETVNEAQDSSASAQEDKPAEPVILEKEESVPVMNPVGAPVPPAPAAPKTGKGWMVASVVLAAALIIVLIKPPFAQKDSDTPVATVNGEAITKSQLYDKLVEAGGKSTLQNLITTTLVAQEAKKANITVTDADLNEELEDLKAQFGGEQAFESALAQSGMTLDDLKKQMPMQVELRKLLEPQVKISDADIKKYYDDNKAQFEQPEEVRASHILVKTKEEADAIEKELKEGKDFAELAKEKSTDTGSKVNGGDLNFFKRGDMVPEFSDAAFKLKVGEISEPVKSQYGYHIIKVTDRKEAKNFTLDEKKDDIRKILVTQKISELSSTWLQETTEKAKITNTLSDPKPDASEKPAATEAPKE